MTPSSSLSFRTSVGYYFDAVAPTYDRWAKGANAKAAERLADLAEQTDMDRVLDMGCGTATATRILAARAGDPANVVGIDVSKNMLAVARDKPGVTPVLLRMPAESLWIASNSIDIVLLGQALPYFEHPVQCLDEAYRVAAPGGKCLVSCRQRSLSTAAQELFFSKLKHLERRHPLAVDRPSADRAAFGEPRVLASLLETAGFADVAVSHLVTGITAKDGEDWFELMKGLGPYPYVLLSSLGSGMRNRFIEDIETSMSSLGEKAYTFHIGFTFATGRKREGDAP